MPLTITNDHDSMAKQLQPLVLPKLKKFKTSEAPIYQEVITILHEWQHDWQFQNHKKPDIRHRQDYYQALSVQLDDWLRNHVHQYATIIDSHQMVQYYELCDDFTTNLRTRVRRLMWGNPHELTETHRIINHQIGMLKRYHDDHTTARENTWAYSVMTLVNTFCHDLIALINPTD